MIFFKAQVAQSRIITDLQLDTAALEAEAAVRVRRIEADFQVFEQEKQATIDEERAVFEAKLQKLADEAVGAGVASNRRATLAGELDTHRWPAPTVKRASPAPGATTARAAPTTAPCACCR